MGLFDWLLRELDLLGRTAPPVPPIRPAPKAGSGTARTAPAPRSQIHGLRNSQPLYEERGWHMRGSSLHGWYRTKYGAFEGQIDNPFGNASYLIFKPPQQLLQGPHGACFSQRDHRPFWLRIPKAYIAATLLLCMDLEQQYTRAKHALLNDKAICSANRAIFRAFFTYQEYKLKRRNGLAHLDRPCYRTLLSYISRLRTVNRWFKNKPWKSLKRADIQRVYDDLEDGRILSSRGRPVQERRTFYDKILRGKPFELAGKGKLVREVMAFYRSADRQEVRFIAEDAFRQLVDTTNKTEHRLLLWLCFDIGENATSILSLRKRDCVRQVNAETGDVEYRINLRKETLKRTRRPRGELTNYRETVQYLDLVLPDKSDDEPLFAFGVAQAAKALRRAVRITGTRCLPAGQVVTLKDLRSSMACDLLAKGWTTDEVNARLGHRPSSRELDKYVNFLALKGERPKRKFRETQITALLERLEAVQQREKLHIQRQERLREDVDSLHKQLDDLNRGLHAEVQRLAKQHFSGKRAA